MVEYLLVEYLLVEPSGLSRGFTLYLLYNQSIEQMELAIAFTAQEQAIYSAHLDFFRFVHKLPKAKAEARAKAEVIAKRPKRRWGFSV